MDAIFKKLNDAVTMTRCGSYSGKMLPVLRVDLERLLHHYEKMREVLLTISNARGLSHDELRAMAKGALNE